MKSTNTLKNVYLVQMPYSVETNKVIYFPYSVGLLWAFSQTFEEVKNNYKLKELLFIRSPIDEIVDGLDNPSLVGMSCYTWTSNYNNALAEKIKQKWPECIIIAGGPDVGNDDDDFFKKYPFYDFAVYNEGEHAFAQLLVELVTEKNYSTVPGIAINNNGKVQRTTKPTRIQNLDNIPSPYLLGLFDDIIPHAAKFGYELNALIETNRGCPYSCTFCDWGNGVLGKVKTFDLKRIKKELIWLAKHKVSWVLNCDANFGIYAKRDLEITKFLVRLKRKFGYPQMFDTNWAKNQTENTVEIAQLLFDEKMLRKFTSSIQTFNKDSLKAIKRSNMSDDQLNEILKLAKEKNIATNTDWIIGLPEETWETFKENLFDASSRGIMLTAGYLTILPNSEMNSPEYRKKYGLKTQLVEKEFQAISEIDEMVIETSTMSQDEMNMAMIYIWFLQQLHDIGYTNLFFDFFAKRYNWSMIEFYEKLIEACLTPADFMPNKWLSKYRNHIQDELTSELTPDIFSNVLRHNMLGHEHRDELFDGFGKHIMNIIPSEDKFLVKDLVTLQKYSQINKKTETTHIFKLQSNLYEYIYKDAILQLEETTYKATRPEIDYKVTFGEFIMLSKWTRTWSTSIEKIDNDHGISHVFDSTTLNNTIKETTW